MQHADQPAPPIFRLGGRLVGMNGAPASDIPIHYTVNRRKYSVNTDSLGAYRFTAPQGARITVSAGDNPEVTVSPPKYAIQSISGNHLGLNFSLSSARI